MILFTCLHNQWERSLHVELTNQSGYTGHLNQSWAGENAEPYTNVERFKPNINIFFDDFQFFLSHDKFSIWFSIFFCSIFGAGYRTCSSTGDVAAGLYMPLESSKEEKLAWDPDFSLNLPCKVLAGRKFVSYTT